MKANHEERFRFALQRIARYLPPSQLRRRSEKLYGLGYEEALEMAYENVLIEAREALKVRKKRAAAKTAKATA